MRIVHAVRSDGFAGVERHVARLARAQHVGGHDVLVVGGAPVAMRAAVAEDGVRLVPATSTADVVRALRRTAPGADIVHVHMTAAEVAVTIAGAARPALPPVVTTRHFARRRGQGARGGLVAAVARARVREQIAISRFVAAHIDGPATIVPPGVEDRPDTRPASDREATVLMVQRLEPEKRTDLGLRAFAASGLARQGWRLRIAGDGTQRDPLLGLAGELGISDAVDLLGTRTDVEVLMGSAGVLLATCPVEGLGLSVLEAMASGLPVLACAAGGHLELLAGLDPNALYPVTDTGRAAEQLRDLASDQARRAEYGRRAQQQQRLHFSLTAQAARTQEVYDRVLLRSGARSGGLR
jgi:glycosyltransferase involved in cell wall biosynthesis